MANKLKHCKGCPINIHHEDGLIADSYGCLPCYSDAKKWLIDTGKIWACHENSNLPCVGLLKNLKRDKINFSINKNTILITESTTLEEIYNKPK